MDRNGRFAAYTGEACIDWCGHHVDETFSVAGNMLAGPAVIDETARVYRERADLPFARRLIAAMRAGEAAGGDKRGKQSAALLVHDGEDYPLYDLRVDDHVTPIPELRRLMTLHTFYFNTDDATLLPFDDELHVRVAEHLATVGELQPGETDIAKIDAALVRWAGRENLEMRLRDDGQIDTVVLELLASASGA